jgi:hypothetical protein
MNPFILLGVILAPRAIADSFIYPPTFGQVGQYSSDLIFTVGQQITLKWDNTTSTDSLSLWLMQDDNNGDYCFQAFTQCQQMTGEQFSLSSVLKGKEGNS